MTQSGDLHGMIAQNLPYLRRYARALTGQQAAGDGLAAETLEAILEDPSRFDRALSPKTALFKVFHGIWTQVRSKPVPDNDPGASAAQGYLRTLTEHSREVLLLHTIEELSLTDIAQIIGVTTADAGQYLSVAYEEMSRAICGRVMIIEDEPLIAMDLELIVQDMGHSVTEIARTAEEAKQKAVSTQPDLILSDIQLADKSSGIDAVDAINGLIGHRPVIFITAFPERLLSGVGPEPTFVIPKPYTEEQVRSAVSQAMFFSSALSRQDA